MNKSSRQIYEQKRKHLKSDIVLLSLQSTSMLRPQLASSFKYTISGRWSSHDDTLVDEICYEYYSTFEFADAKSGVGVRNRRAEVIHPSPVEPTQRADSVCPTPPP